MLVCFWVFYVPLLGITGINLSLMSERHAFPQFLYPYQFFQFGWNYAFFYLLNVSPTDTNSNPITVSWVLVQLALQLNVFMQNTGNYEVLLLAFGKTIRQIVRSADPFLKVQFLAKRAVQYNHADIANIVIVPSICFFFIYRDGWYTLHKTGVVLYECHEEKLFIRFVFLACLKPVTAYLSRVVLARKMRKMLLQKDSGHGDSVAIRELHALRQDKIFTKDRASADASLEKQLQHAGYDLRNLNYIRLKRNLIQASWRYFGCAILFIMFIIFPRHKWTPYPGQRGLPLGDSAVIVRHHNAWSHIGWDSALYLDVEALVAVSELANNSACFDGRADYNPWSELTSGWGGGEFGDRDFAKLQRLFYSLGCPGLSMGRASDALAEVATLVLGYSNGTADDLKQLYSAGRRPGGGNRAAESRDPCSADPDPPPDDGPPAGSSGKAKGSG
uniref:Uncharacterized protein n=1 Tax=Haptolina ericina TaxID=156174 RepID=A0A7S3BX71_9EUKA